MKLSNDEAFSAIRDIIASGSAIDERGTVGAISLPANKGWDKDVILWFVTDSKERGTAFPLTRDQALELRDTLQKAVDISKGLAP